MRNSPEDEEFNKINIVIPKYKNRHFFRRVDNTPSSQYKYNRQKYYVKIEVYYYSTLDVLIISIEDRFKQETTDIIHSVATLINLEFNLI